MVVLLRNFKNIFLVSDLRKKILFTLIVLAVYRFGVHVPLPGIDTIKLAGYMKGVGAGGFLGWLDLISGGALQRLAIFALGIQPYISASIMMSLLTVMIPTLEQYAKEGEYGRRIINQYTRYLTLLLSIVQGSAIVVFAQANGLVLSPGWSFRVMAIFILSVGSLFVMWFGEQITSHGIGNGSSLLIFGSIVADLPGAIVKTIKDIQLDQMDPFMALILLATAVTVAACVVFMERGERKIPVQYAKRIIGNKIYGGQSSYIPLKINVSGVMPVIFTNSVIAMPIMLTKFLASKFKWLEGAADALSYGGLLFYILQTIFIVFFAYFYAAIQLNPEDVAENMKKSGGFIPGIRPGRKTAEFFNYVLNRVTFPGAMYLALLCIIPGILAVFFGFHRVFSGISLLIVVGVALDTSAQIESYLIERRYEGFLSTGRLKGKRG
ncbi:preprotein translocase subunit SecY [Candidatus Babeliales bacterium]|nr:preprotein translocase subunit SecY [Candidatus Babeliales bacterium]